MPAEAHGDEHDVIVFLEVPFWSAQWVKHKANLNRSTTCCSAAAEYICEFQAVLSACCGTWKNHVPCRMAKLLLINSSTGWSRLKTSRKVLAAPPNTATRSRE